MLIMKSLFMDTISASDENQIHPPLRSTGGGTVAICAVIALLSSVMLLPHRVGLWTVAALALLTICGTVSRSVQAIHLSLFGLLWVTLPFMFSLFRPWPFSMLIPIVFYGITVAALAPLHRSFGWLRRGRLGSDILRLVLMVIVISSVALIIWYVSVRPDLSRNLRNMPQMPVWMFPFAGLAFALGNAALEEAIFRGIIMDALDSAFGPGRIAVALQAVPFAILHYVAGFPRGGWGLLMTFVYGLMLGMIRRRAGGMLAPWLAHVAADSTIFAILALVVLQV